MNELISLNQLLEILVAEFMADHDAKAKILETLRRLKCGGVAYLSNDAYVTYIGRAKYEISGTRRQVDMWLRPGKAVHTSRARVSTRDAELLDVGILFCHMPVDGQLSRGLRSCALHYYDEDHKAYYWGKQKSSSGRWLKRTAHRRTRRALNRVAAQMARGESINMSKVRLPRVASQGYIMNV